MTDTAYLVTSAAGTAQNTYRGTSVQQVAELVFGRGGRTVTVTPSRRNGTWNIAASTDLGIVARATIRPIARIA